MKKCLFTILMGIFSFTVLKGQTVESILGPSTDYMFGPASIRKVPLFNPEEIKERKVERCTIIKHSFNYNTNTAEPNTLHIYDFDSTGNIEMYIRFGSYPNKKDTFDYKATNNWNYKKIDSSVTIINGNKIVETYYIWGFNWQQPEVIDTGIVVRRVYDDKNRLVEWKSNGTTDYHKVIFCGTGITYHHKYEYDERSNITSYDLADYRYYALYKHTPRGIAVSVHNKKLEEKPRKYLVKIKRTTTEIVENDGGEIATLKFLSGQSKLFSELSNRQTGKGIVPTVYKFIYEYKTDSKNQTPSNSLVLN